MCNQVEWVPQENGQLDLRIGLNEKEFIGDGPISIQVSHSLFDLIPSWSWFNIKGKPWTPQSSIIGKVVESKTDDSLKGKTVFGIGKVADRIKIEPEKIISVFDDKDEEFHLYLAQFSKLIDILKRSKISLGERTLILGAGLMGKLTSQLAFIAGSSSIEVRDIKKPKEISSCADFKIYEEKNGQDFSDKKYDLLLDTSGNLDWINNCASGLKTGGRIVLMADNYNQKSFDFYKCVHLKSLKLIGGSLNNSNKQVNDLEFLLHQISTGRLKAPIDSVNTVKAVNIDKRVYSEGIIVDWRK